MALAVRTDYSCVDSKGGVDSYMYGSCGEDCYSCVNGTGSGDSYGTGGKNCYSCENSTDGGDSYGTGGEDRYSCVDSTGDVDN